MGSDQQEQPELPGWLSDQVEVMARDTAEAVHLAWQHVEEHVPPQVVAALPPAVLIGTGPQVGAFRFLDEVTGGTVAEVRDRPDDGLVTVMKFGEVVAWSHGAFVGRMALPKTEPSADPSAN